MFCEVNLILQTEYLCGFQLDFVYLFDELVSLN